MNKTIIYYLTFLQYMTKKYLFIFYKCSKYDIIICEKIITYYLIINNNSRKYDLSINTREYNVN